VSAEQTELAGPDLARGVPLSEIPDGGMLAGHALGKPVLLVRRGSDVFATGATCTHYGAPLVDGLLVGETLRCPWHHACFSVRTGEAIGAPAFASLGRWEVQHRGGMIVVTREDESTPRSAPPARSDSAPRSVVIVGAGAAGFAAADMLRRQEYDGPITMIGSDESGPYDRPNLSKDYLAGNAPEEWIPLRPSEFYEERKIRLMLGRRVTTIDRAQKRVVLDDGTGLEFGALLLATGASPVRLPGSVDAGRAHYLRTLADSRAIIAASEGARRAVVIGASFIGLEVAASLRGRGLEVHVVAPESRPLERIMGAAIGDFVRRLHEEKGVVFHLGRTSRAIDAESVTLDDGERIPSDLVVAGIGVRPDVALAEQAELAVDRGIAVDEFLETSTPGIFAAGDVARYPDARTGEHIRVEHWVAAERQGQAAARNMLGRRERFTTVPFFWSQHYDVAIRYVGHAERWDDVEISGNLGEHDCLVSFRSKGMTLAVATVGRDRDNLRAEVAMEAQTTMSVA
jgi:3-phenylpropionate/trans-cinnamate dioxygenase ferredoxin reductase subunit